MSYHVDDKVRFSMHSYCSLSTFATSGVDYPWLDNQKKVIKASAPQHIDFIMTFIQNQFDDETVFPTKAGSHSTCLSCMLMTVCFGIG